MTDETPSIIRLDDLAHTQHAHEFIGAEHGDFPFSIILVHSAPGVGPNLHRHPYAEVFVVDSGQATFQLGEETIVVDEGHIVVGPPGVPHGFTNTGPGELRLTAIHGADRFTTEWLSGPDPVWTSKPTDEPGIEVAEPVDQLSMAASNSAPRWPLPPLVPRGIIRVVAHRKLNEKSEATLPRSSRHDAGNVGAVIGAYTGWA